MRQNILPLLCCLLLAIISPSAQAADGSLVGKDLPSLKVKWLQATPDLKGKPLIVEFWATWCPPCRQSIPHLNSLYAKFKPQGLEIIGITDEEKDAIQKFTKSIPINYPIALDNQGKTSSQFGITSIPRAFLVDKSGKIVWDGHPMELQESKITEVLK